MSVTSRPGRETEADLRSKGWQAANATRRDEASELGRKSCAAYEAKLSASTILSVIGEV